MKKKLAIISAFMAVVCFVSAIICVVRIDNNAYFSPDYEKQDLSALINKESYCEEDYKTFFYQTGLGKIAIDQLKQTETFTSSVMKAQENFFAPKNVTCQRKAITTNMEYFVDSAGFMERGFSIFCAQAGDVVIMESSHSFGWRHGHAGLVLDEMYTLEAPIINVPAGRYYLSEWETYPTFMLLRLKDADKEFTENLAKDAYKNIKGARYSVLAGVFNKKYTDKTPDGVQCASMVWYAYKNAGIDIDASGGKIVTVQDIKNSDKFEIVQIFGYNPAQYWQK